MPSVTVVVPTHNRPDMLRDALDSIRRQTFDDFECLIVDDRSEPPVQAPADARFRLVRLDGVGGCSVARNAGITAARGTYVTFLDDDDIWTAAHLECLMAESGADRIVIGQRGDLATQRPAAHRKFDANAHDTILDSYTPSLGQAMIPRDACPQFDETFTAAEDIDWWLRATERIPRIVTVPAVTYLVRQHREDRGTHGRSARLECSYRLLRKHDAYFQAHPTARWFRWLRIAQLESQRRYALTAAARSLAGARRPWQVFVSIRILLRALIRSGQMDNRE